MFPCLIDLVTSCCCTPNHCSLLVYLFVSSYHLCTLLFLCRQASRLDHRGSFYFLKLLSTIVPFSTIHILFYSCYCALEVLTHVYSVGSYFAIFSYFFCDSFYPVSFAASSIIAIKMYSFSFFGICLLSRFERLSIVPSPSLVGTASMACSCVGGFGVGVVCDV